jgi:hypothetical protein
MSTGTALKLTPIQWLICIIAVIGFAFDNYAPTKVALVAAGVGFSVLLIGFLLSYWLPEPGKEEL